MNFTTSNQARPEPPAPPAVGEQSSLLIKYDQEGKEIRKSVTLKIVGQISETRNEPDWSVYLPIEDLVAYNEWMTGRRVNRNRDGYNQVVVKVNDVKDVLNITEQINTLGYQAYTPQSFVQGINFLCGFASHFWRCRGNRSTQVAIGIANTMTMATRAREIGLMKAGCNKSMPAFPRRSAGIGFWGWGLVLGWSANPECISHELPGRALLNRKSASSVAVYTPVWLLIFALVFAT
jgi:putative ABC transport system permease protein